jgi:putative endonuclease
VKCKEEAVYIMTNNHNTTLYIGVTANLPRRIREHKEKVHPKSFTARYNLFKLVYYETFHSIEEAVAREKQLKRGSRRKKEALIAAFNQQWVDLFDEVTYTKKSDDCSSL